MIGAQVGRLETGEPLVLDFSMASHTIIQGSTRSGKSVLTYGILASLAQRDDVQIRGCDPSGILLAPWIDQTDKIAVDTGDMEHHAEVLEGTVTEMSRRVTEDIRGKMVDKIDTFSPDLPLIVVVLEEYPGLLDGASMADSGLKASEKVEPRIKRAVSRLLSEGAKAGIRVLMLCQRADADVVGGRQRSQYATAITLRVPDATAVRMLHQNVPDDIAASIPMAKPGVGVIERPGFPIQRFRSALLEYSDYIKYTTRRKENV